MKPTVLILAGCRPGAEDPVARAERVPHKALADVDGRTLLGRVVGAAREFGAREVVVSAAHPAVAGEAHRLGATVLPSAKGPSESVALAFERFGAPLLVTTADHALLEADWLRAMVEQAPAGADLVVMMAQRELVEAAAPGTSRTWIELADGCWSGCNLFLLLTPAAALAAAAWQEVEADRRHPWRIAFRFGAATWVIYFLGRLTMAGAIARLGRRIGVQAALVPALDGRAAIDVDKPEDLVLVRRLAVPPESGWTPAPKPAAL